VSDNTSIEWTDTTWNPTTGCTKVSPGCDNCYAEKIVERFHRKGAFEIVTRSEPKLWAPFKWRKPRKVFVNSMSDLFHDQVPDSFIVQVFSVMARTQQHTYQLLTKRHGRMRSLLNQPAFQNAVASLAPDAGWPLRNLWLGVSVEDQKRADLRIPALLDTPAAVRWLSCEPLLGPINLADADSFAVCDGGIDWVVVGGESGHGARPMHPDWARSLRDQCVDDQRTAEMDTGIPFFFKQWGEWAPNGWRGIGNFTGRERLVGPAVDDKGHREVIERLGKKAAGRELDGRTWEEFPAAVTTEAVTDRG
jgi:protein gp37